MLVVIPPFLMCSLWHKTCQWYTSLLAWVPHLYTFQGLPGSIISLMSGIVTASCIPVPGQGLWRSVFVSLTSPEFRELLVHLELAVLVVVEQNLLLVVWTHHIRHTVSWQTHTHMGFFYWSSFILSSFTLYTLTMFILYKAVLCSHPREAQGACLAELNISTKLNLGNILYGCLIKVTTNSGLNVYQPKSKKCYTDTVKCFEAQLITSTSRHVCVLRVMIHFGFSLQNTLSYTCIIIKLVSATSIKHSLNL